jgi:hypothetical protein
MRYFNVLGLCGVLAASALAAQPPDYPSGRYPGLPSGRFDRGREERLVAYWVRSYFRRHADPEDVEHFAGQLRRGRPPEEVLAGLLASREYYEYSGGTWRGFIKQLLLDVGHHEPSAEEVGHHVHRTRGQDPAEVAHRFLMKYPQNWVPGRPGRAPRDRW